MRYSLFILILIFTFLSCKNESSHPIQNAIEKVTKVAESDIGLIWELTEVNRGEENFSKVNLTIQNGSNKSFEKDWTIYFNAMSGMPSISPGLNFENISGSFNKITPTEEFKAIPAGESITIPLEYERWIMRKSSAPLGVYIIFGEGDPETITNYDIKGFNNKTVAALNPPTAKSRYEENKNLTLLPANEVPKIIPRPNLITFGEQTFGYEKNILIQYQKGLQKEASHLQGLLKNCFAGNINIKEAEYPQKRVIFLQYIDSGIEGSYELSVNGGLTNISGKDNAGIFYGIQSLMAMIPMEKWAKPDNSLDLQYCEIKDAPRFGYRGMHLDVARNFIPKEKVLKLIDLMSFYKLNKFHFHLTDDEGWRLAIKGLPELTTVGATRGHTLDENDRLYPAYGSGPDPNGTVGSGFYTRKDFIEILQFANDRHIEVIPEFDVPGHALSAIKAMEARYRYYMEQGDEAKAKQYLLSDAEDASEYRSAQNYTNNVICVCQEGPFNFMETMIDDVVSMYKEAGAPLTTIHSGGDEVPYGAWQKSPVCAKFLSSNTESLKSTDQLHAYFMQRFKVIMDKHNLVTAGWEEIVLRHTAAGHHVTEINPDFVNQKMLPYVWNATWGWGREDMCYKLANIGYPVVMCNSAALYFDLAYDRDPQETGLSWSGFVDTKKPFELIPLDIFKNAKTDLMGNPLDMDAIAQMKRLTDKGKANFLGIQGQLWAETLIDPDMMEYYTFPKLLALAERAWSTSPEWASIENTAQRDKAMEADWNIFTNALGQRELTRLNYLCGGVDYRIPLAGGVIENGNLKANVRFPGLTIRYTTDGSEPNKKSTIYTQPVKVEGKEVRLRVFNSEGRSGRDCEME